MTFPDSETGDGFTESVWSDTFFTAEQQPAEQLTNPLVILENPSNELLYSDSVTGKDTMSDRGRGCEGNMICVSCVSCVYQLLHSLVPHLSLWPKLTILFMPPLPLLIISLGSPTAGSGGPETNYFT